MCYLMEWITEVNWTATNRMKAGVLSDLHNFTDACTIKFIYVQLELNLDLYLAC